MAEPATVTTRAPWHQQPGENDLWYSRFLRFVALGPSRSVSLVAKGRRNAYPIPAHWPIQAKQRLWRERAQAFDDAVKADPTVLAAFNDSLKALVDTPPNGERKFLEAVIGTGGYQAPPPEEDYGDEPRASAGR